MAAKNSARTHLRIDGRTPATLNVEAWFATARACDSRGRAGRRLGSRASAAPCPLPTVYGLIDEVHLAGLSLEWLLLRLGTDY